MTEIVKDESMRNMRFIRKLPIPKEVKELYPLSEKGAAIKARRDGEIADVFTGKSGKFLLVIGPCSADNEEAVCDYIGRLARVQEKVADRVLILSSRPAAVRKTVEIRFTADGLTPMERRQAPEFKDYFNEIWKELNHYA